MVFDRFAINPEHYIVHQPAGYPNVSSPFHVAVARGSLKTVDIFLDLIGTQAELVKPDPAGLFPIQVFTALYIYF